MTRRTQRRYQAAQSLLMKVRRKPCQHPDCFNSGLGCYDDPAGPVAARFCQEHRALHGYCHDCGTKDSSERFTNGPGKGFCDVCWDAMQDQDTDPYFDPWNGDDDDDF